jgi:hypothetical protein
VNTHVLRRTYSCAHPSRLTAVRDRGLGGKGGAPISTHAAQHWACGKGSLKGWKSRVPTACMHTVVLLEVPEDVRAVLTQQTLSPQCAPVSSGRSGPSGLDGGIARSVHTPGPL